MVITFIAITTLVNIFTTIEIFLHLVDLGIGGVMTKSSSLFHVLCIVCDYQNLLGPS